MRSLSAIRKVELIDGETLETSHDFTDEVAVSESVTASIDLHRANENIGVSDDTVTDLNRTITYVLGPYFPSSFADTKRAFLLDISPLG